MQSINKMKPRKIIAAAMALLLGVTAVPTAWAATEEPGGQQLADYIYYRSRAKDTFDGEIDTRRSGGGAVTGVNLKSDPILHLTEFDDAIQRFDSLFTSGTLLLDVEREGGTDRVEAKMAVYDRLELVKGTGSVSLTVKDNRSLKPIVGAVYNLYQGKELLEEGLTSDDSGNITVLELKEGSYELRQARVPAEYVKTDTPVPFTIGGVELGGGETQITTTSGRTIRADSGEVLLGGSFSPDITLKATHEKQITSVTATFEGYGSKLDEDGRLVYGTSQKELYSSIKEAQDGINEAKNSGAICGAVKVNYSLTGAEGKATCKFTQYVGAVIQEETPAPTPTATPVPTRAPTERPNPTAVPTPTERPVPTYAPANNTPAPAPTKVPTPTPDPYGTITVFANCKTEPLEGILFELMGKTTAGTGINKTYLTDRDGLITIEKVPDGSYSVSVKETEDTVQYDIPYDQRVDIRGGTMSYLKMDFDLLTGTVSGTVIDPDGEPLPNVTVGIYSVADKSTAKEDLSGRVKSEEEWEDISGKTYYNAANALAIALSTEDGEITFKRMEIGEYELVPIVSGGYYAPAQPTACSVTGKEGDQPVEVMVECTKVSIQLLGKHGGALVGRTVTLSNSDGSTWETAAEPNVIKGLRPGGYTLTVKEEEGKEKIPPYQFTVEDRTALQTVEVNTTAVHGELEKPASSSSGTESQAGEQEGPKDGFSLLWIVIPAAVILLGTFGFLLWKRREKGEDGEIK